MSSLMKNIRQKTVAGLFSLAFLLFLGSASHSQAEVEKASNGGIGGTGAHEDEEIIGGIGGTGVRDMERPELLERPDLLDIREAIDIDEVDSDVSIDDMDPPETDKPEP